MAGYELEEALHLILNATHDGDIRTALKGLSDPEARHLNNSLEEEFGSDIEDMLAEPGFDKQEWAKVVANAVRSRDDFRRR